MESANTNFLNKRQWVIGQVYPSDHPTLFKNLF